MPELNYLIKTTADLAGAEAADKVMEKLQSESRDTAKEMQAANVATEALTNSGKGLATNLPDLDAVTKKFTITTEAEYLAIVKAHAAVSDRIPVLEAAGKNTDAFRKAQENLSVALSTENALLIAQKIENKAAAVTAAEKAAADLAAGEAAAINSGAMREMATIARELSTGHFSRLPGSISILAQKADLLKYAFSAAGLSIMGVGVAAYFLYEHLENVNKELDDTAKALDAQNLSEHAEAIRIVDSAWENASESLGKYLSALDFAGSDNDPIETQIKRSKELIAVQLEGIEAITKAYGEQYVARLQATGASPEQIATAQEQNRLQQEAIQNRKETALGSGALEEEFNDRYAQATKLKVAAGVAYQKKQKADAQYALDEKSLKDASDALDPTTLTGKAILKRQQNAQKALDQANAEPDKIADEFGSHPNLTKSEDIKKAQADKETIDAEIAQNKALKDQLMRSQAERDRKRDDADEAYRKAIDESEKNTDRLKQLPAEIKQDQDVEGAKRSSKKTINAQNAASLSLGADRETADALIGGKTVSYDAAQKVIQDASTIAGHTVDLGDAIKIIENGAHNIDIFMRQLQRLTNAFSKLTPNAFSDIERRIEQVERIANRALINSNLL